MNSTALCAVDNTSQSEANNATLELVEHSNGVKLFMEANAQILVIEDNQSFRQLIGHLLGKHYRVITQPDGIAAMKWLSEGNYPDLILLDLELPGMTGKDFLTGLKTSGFYGSIPVMILSGNKPDTFSGEAMKDVIFYFEKPFDPRKLLEKIEQLFLPPPAELRA